MWVCIILPQCQVCIHSPLRPRRLPNLLPQPVKSFGVVSKHESTCCGMRISPWSKRPRLSTEKERAHLRPEGLNHTFAYLDLLVPVQTILRLRCRANGRRAVATWTTATTALEFPKAMGKSCSGCCPKPHGLIRTGLLCVIFMTYIPVHDVNPGMAYPHASRQGVCAASAGWHLLPIENASER